MSVLSAQSIRALCIPREEDGWYYVHGARQAVRVMRNTPLIAPFTEAEMVRGRSVGLSACSYDCRAADKVLIPVGQARLAATMERFSLPGNICGSVLDKSTWARVFLSAFNTHLDPGWQGYLTVELANLGDAVVEIEPGDPLVQVKFEWLDEPTELPYRGKYQNQEPGPQRARYGR